MNAFLKDFLEDQLWNLEPQTPDAKKVRVKVRGRVWWTAAKIGSIIVSYHLDDFEWKTTFVITPSVMGGALIWFLCGIPFYHPKFTGNLNCSASKVDSNPFNTMLKVLQAARRNRRLEYPSSPSQLYENDGNQVCLSPQVKLLRWIDKASLIASAGSTNSDKQICTVTEVKNCKLFLKMVPLWSTFLAFNLTKATGDTFFPEQGDSPTFRQEEQQKTGLFLLLFIVIQKNIIPPLFSWLFSILIPKDNHRIQNLGMLAGMILSPICFAIAWKVEARRIGDMSILWLAPQFFVLGLMDGLAAWGLDEFLIHQFPAEWGSYISSTNLFLEGIGNFLSIFCLHVRKNLFDVKDLNLSRLGKYYEFILIIASVNVGYFLLVQAIVYRSNYVVKDNKGIRRWNLLNLLVRISRRH